MPSESNEEIAEDESRGYPTEFEPDEPEDDSDPHEPEKQDRPMTDTIPDDMPEAPATAPSTALLAYNPETDGTLVKLNPIVEAIQKYGERRAGDLITTGMTRKQIRDLAHERTMEGTRLRTTSDKIAASLKEDALRIQNNVNTAKKNIITAVTPIEDEWRTLRDKCDREEQEEKEKAQREMEEKVSGRANKLTALGISVQIRFVKNQPWALLYAGTTPLTEADLSVFGESLLWSMTDAAFDARLENVTNIIDAKVREQVAAERELKRLQLDERLRTRSAELRALEADPDVYDTLREMEEPEYQKLITAARQIITERQATVQRQLDEQARVQREQAEKLERQAAEIKAALRRQRQQALDVVQGLHPVDQSGTPLDIAEMEHWDEYLAGQTQVHEERKAAEKLALEAEATYRLRCEKITALKLNHNTRVLRGMSDSEWALTLEMSQAEAKTRDEHEAAQALRTTRLAQWNATPGHALIPLEEPIELYPVEEFNTLLMECEVAENKRLEAIAQAQREAQERMAPDREALEKYADDLMAVSMPSMTTPEGDTELKRVRAELVSLCNRAGSL